VVDRYRERLGHGGSPLHFDSVGAATEVQLHGWVESDDGTLDLQEVDDELLFALRDVVARIVEFWVDKPDEAEHIERMDQGERRVDFREKDLDASVFQPLRRFDERDVYF
jgi:hypothetical protein